MIKQSLGLIETVGFSTAIEAADTAVKSANVTLVGYELTKGSGMVVVKILGEVGAVSAAIEAARVSSSKLGVVYATKVIARIGENLDIMLDGTDPKIPNETLAESIVKIPADNENRDIPFIETKVVSIDPDTTNDQSHDIEQTSTIVITEQLPKIKLSNKTTKSHRSMPKKNHKKTL